MTAPVDLVFDLDGTISDPLVGISRCVNFALRAYGFDEVPAARVAALVGPPLDEAFRTLRPELDEPSVTALIAKYRERYARSGFAENSMYEEISTVLEALAQRGGRLGVCTSKRVDFAEKVLERFGIRQHFAFVDGGDVGISKDAQLRSLIAAGRIDGSARMIGDRAVDIGAAKVNGLASVGVLWGYGSRSELLEAGADLIIERPGELLGWPETHSP